MKDETRLWLAYAEENLALSRLSLEREYLNACLQNAQQAVEKGLKALLVEKKGGFPRSHSIRELARLAEIAEGSLALSSEDCDLLDSIYIPSKYPVFGVLPEHFADREVCLRCVLIAEKVLEQVRTRLQTARS